MRQHFKATTKRCIFPPFHIPELHKKQNTINPEQNSSLKIKPKQTPKLHLDHDIYGSS